MAKEALQKYHLFLRKLKTLKSVEAFYCKTMAETSEFLQLHLTTPRTVS